MVRPIMHDNAHRRLLHPGNGAAIGVSQGPAPSRFAQHAGSVSFFRSNQLLIFAKIRLSATEAALDAHDWTFSSRVLTSSMPSVSAWRPIARAASSTFRPHSNE